MANGVAERFNRTMLSRIRSQLCQSGLPLSLWGELAMYCSLQINCTPSSTINNNIPLKLFESLIPTHTHPFSHRRLKAFGCLAFAHDRHQKSKVAPPSKRYIFVGIEPNARAWRLWDKQSQRIFITGDAIFLEDVFPAADHPTSPSVSDSFTHPVFQDAVDSITHTHDSITSDHHIENDMQFNSDTNLFDTPHHQENLSDTPHPENPSTHDSQTDDEDLPQTSMIEDTSVSDPPRRSSRKTTVLIRYGFAASVSHDSDHPTYTQAMASPDKAAWLTAMQEEFEAFKRHSVGTLVDAPARANILGGMWVFNQKRDEFNRVCCFKARWVVFGNHQIKGLDYNDTHASVGMTDSLRILFAIAANTGMKVCQFDIVTAFLNGDMGDTVYSRQVTGFTHPTHPHRVWLLNKSLYGTRQAARRWQQHFNKTAQKFNLNPSSSDSAVYVCKDSLGLLILHLHVDDSMVFASSAEVMERFKVFIHGEYDLKWTDRPSLYLGIRITTSKDGSLIAINQSHYIESTLERFAMVNCKPVKSPLPYKTILTPGSAEDIAAAIDLPYQSLVGSLGWIASTTRPDISYAVSQLGRFNSAWTTTHWTAAKHVLRYLRGTQDLSITYSNGPLTPSAYSDSDFSQCPTSRRSVSGFVVTLGGGIVSWRSERQSVVALSTNEAEYMAAAECAKHMAWVRSFLFYIMFDISTAIPFFVDNKSAIDTATGESINCRSKHIERRYHFIREQCQAGFLKIHHIPTEDMLADHLTKPLGPTGVKHALQLNNLLKSA